MRCCPWPQVPLNFQITAPPHQPGMPASGQVVFRENPQTEEFIERFGLRKDFRSQTFGMSGKADGAPASVTLMFAPMEASAEMLNEEIDIDDCDE